MGWGNKCVVSRLLYLKDEEIEIYPEEHGGILEGSDVRHSCPLWCCSVLNDIPLCGKLTLSLQ